MQAREAITQTKEATTQTKEATAQTRAPTPTVNPLSLSFTITKVLPVTMMLRVNVTADASVWCGAWPEGETINLQFIQMNLPGMLVHGLRVPFRSSTESKYILLTGLQPSTTYDVTCLGLAQNVYMRDDPLRIKQRVRTGDAEFEITTAVAKGSNVYVTLNCNLGIAVLCLLFNEKGGDDVPE